MPDVPRLHTDAHISPDVAIQLRQHGYDAVSARELQMLAASDEKHLERAISEQRVVVTSDRDFQRLHVAYLMAEREHWGIIYSNERSTREIIRRLRTLLTLVTADDMRNQFRWLSEFR